MCTASLLTSSIFVVDTEPFIQLSLCLPLSPSLSPPLHLSPPSLSTGTMRYVSTRGGQRTYSFEEAIISGWAENGGMLLPQSFPRFTPDALKAMRYGQTHHRRTKQQIFSSLTHSAKERKRQRQRETEGQRFLSAPPSYALGRDRPSRQKRQSKQKDRDILISLRTRSTHRDRDRGRGRDRGRDGRRTEVPISLLTHSVNTQRQRQRKPKDISLTLFRPHSEPYALTQQTP
jgi:hypothetical protein